MYNMEVETRLTDWDDVINVIDFFDTIYCYDCVFV